MPEKAIWLEEAIERNEIGTEVNLLRPRVNSERCIGCGKCEKNCPLDDKPAIYVTSSGERRQGDM